MRGKKPVQRQDRALLLRRQAYGETSLVGSVLSERHGRVDLLARGAYRPTSRFYAVLDPFHTLELRWSERPRTELQLLDRGDLDRRRKRIPTDLESYRTAQAMVELIELAAVPGQPEPELFQLLEEALERLELGRTRPDLERARFDFAFLEGQGLFPALDHCASCGRDAPPVFPGERYAFAARIGGRLCRECALRARAEGLPVGTLPAHLFALCQRLAAGQHEALEGLSQGAVEELLDFCDRFLDVHLETRPKSRRKSRPRPAHSP